MKTRNKMIWYDSTTFLSTFRSLVYDSIPLGPLFLRDFQKYIVAHHPTHLNKHKMSTCKRSQLQASCQPYFIDSQPDFTKTGYALVRAELYPSTSEMKGQKCIYLAHHKHEYRRMVQYKNCRPLFYIQHLPESTIPNYEKRRVYHTLKHILSSSSIPPLYKSKHFKGWLYSRIAATLKVIRKLRYLFDRYPICKTVYGSTINRHGILVTSYAQSRNLLTINIQHGIFGEIGHLPVNADLNLVWGESHLEYLASFGAAKEKIRVIRPTFVRSLPSASEAHIKEERKSNNRFRLLVALQPLGFQYNKKMISRIEKAAKQIPKKIRISYKLHPDQGNGTVYQKYLSAPTSIIIPHNKMPLQHLIQQSNIIITPFSSVGYEGLLHGKPVLFYGKQTKVYYMKGKPIFIRTTRGLQKYLSTCVAQPAYLSTLSSKMALKDTHVQDKHSQLKIWEVIKSFINDHQKNKDVLV